MSSIGTPSGSATPTSISAQPGVLGSAWFDRTIAAIACVPFVFFGYERYLHGGLNLPLIILWIELAMLIVPMLIRRPPKRVTTNPWFWLLTYIETYWLLMPILGPGHPIVSRTTYDVVAFVGLGICVWGRVSLGRNIGFVPAQRELVAGGAYKYMRHPLYASLLVVDLSVALAVYSPRNVVLIAIGMFWFLLKSVVEESFLKLDPQYAAYMQRVRARWIPFVI